MKVPPLRLSERPTRTQDHSPLRSRGFRSEPRGVTRKSLIFAWLGATVLATLPRVASAQDAAIEDEFSVQRFNPAPGPRNYFTTRGVRTDGEMAWSAGLVINY